MAETNHRRLEYYCKIPVSSVLLVKKGLEKSQTVPEDQSCFITLHFHVTVGYAWERTGSLLGSLSKPYGLSAPSDTS